MIQNQNLKGGRIMATQCMLACIGHIWGNFNAYFNVIVLCESLQIDKTQIFAA